MYAKLLPCVALALAAAIVVSTTSWAAEPITQEGMVVSAGGGKLTMKDKGGKESTHTIGTEAKITVNGKPGKLEELKLGTPIRVTTDGATVLAVATIDEVK
jgi:hypothetical protein